MSLNFPKVNSILQVPALPDYRYEKFNCKVKPAFQDHSSDEIGNVILNNLPIDLLRQLEPYFQKTAIKKGQTVFGIGDALNFVYFPNDCVASRIALTEDGATVEVGMIGREGIWGIRALFGATRANYQTIAETEGTAIKISILPLKILFEKNSEVRERFLGFYEDLLSQVSQRAVCRCRHTIRQQLSAWLLHFHSKAQTDKLCITQEKIAHRLGTRRASVTVAISDLQAKNIVRCGRGYVKILDRASLEKNSCECLGTANAAAI